LFEEPGLATAIRLSLTSALGAALLALAATIAFAAGWSGTAADRRLRRWLAPLLGVPHLATAFGLAFLIAPSGWIARLLSPWATGWSLPPDLITVRDPAGIALTLGLAAKEFLYLTLMRYAAESQIPIARLAAAARSLGRARCQAWCAVVLPQVWPQLRLPVAAVVAYGVGEVEMALVLGPTTPPPLAPLVLRLARAPDLDLLPVAAAGALLQLALTVVAVAALWAATARAIRLRPPEVALRIAGRAAATAIVATLIMASLALVLWSVTRQWPFPAGLPTFWTPELWTSRAARLLGPAATTLGLGLAAVAVALPLALAVVARTGDGRIGWLVQLPLLLPPTSFLLGMQVLILLAGPTNGWTAVVLAHLPWVGAYVALTMAAPWATIPRRLEDAARSLGARRARRLLRVRLPLLARPLAVAAAIGFAVSVGLYLPTLFAGGGRVATLATEAMALAAGADRRTIGLLGTAQTLMPALAFLLALMVPAAPGLSRARVSP
jgi:putative thiamine transport system permease protein